MTYTADLETLEKYAPQLGIDLAKYNDEEIKELIKMVSTMVSTVLTARGE